MDELAKKRNEQPADDWMAKVKQDAIENPLHGVQVATMVVSTVLMTLELGTRIVSQIAYIRQTARAGKS
jgi:hypothetical protein